MIRVICLIITLVFVVAVVATVGYVGVKMGGYIFNQNFGANEAFDWAIQDYKDLLGIGKAKVNLHYYTWENNINRYVDVVPCTALK